MKFYIGLHQPSDAGQFARCMISVNRLSGPKGRKTDFEVGEWMMDSGAFTEVAIHGGYRTTPMEYARQIVRWSTCGQMVCAVAQDFMCEEFVLRKRNMTVRYHQALTIARYLRLLHALRQLTDSHPYILPVLQGYRPSDYADHVRMYGSLLPEGAWVGVGSVCKRNGEPEQVEDVLLAIHAARPDLRLHGFGLKLTALRSDVVRQHLATADSLAWSYAARKQGRNGNDWREAEHYAERVATIPAAQTSMIPDLMEVA